VREKQEPIDIALVPAHLATRDERIGCHVEGEGKCVALAVNFVKVVGVIRDD
jgi:hypothetical protein